MRTIRFLLAFLLLAIPASLFAQLRVSVAFGPPAIPMYAQPECPGDGYIWTPGYWAYDNDSADYYWVPGTWVEAPEEGFLWTPGYWGWGDGGYFFNEGYWGQEVGFYGGINYGFGYWGGGYDGGRWDHGHFFYNRAYNRLDGDRFHNVYNEDKHRDNNENHVSFNGGKGGIEERPNSQQESAAKQRHIPQVAAQSEHQQAARANPEQRVSVNRGKPSIAATSKPVARNEHEKGTKSPVEANKTGAGGEEHNMKQAVHPKELPAIARPAPVNSGNVKADQKYEAKQTQLINKQTADREKLQQKQDTEHQQKANANQQKLEQKHTQQTQHLAQKHTTQQQTLQTHQPQPRATSGGGQAVGGGSGGHRKD
jgi:hypothetical protein